MAPVATILSDRLQELRDLNVDTILARHVLFENRLVAGFDIAWKDFGGTDRTVATFPTFRLFDGYHNKPTKPDPALPGTEWKLEMDLGTPISLDSIWVSGHDWNTVDVIEFRVEVADDATFTVGLTEIFKVVGAPVFASDGRFALLDLGNAGDPAPNKYSGVQHIRLFLKLGGAGSPKLNELVMGERIQLADTSLIPFDENQEDSSFNDFPSRSGNVSRFTKFRGRAVRPYRFVTDSDVEKDDFLAWWDAILQGTRPFVIIHEPKAPPDGAPDDGIAVLLDTNKFVYPQESGNRMRRLDMPVFEIPPFIKNEQVG